jgi:hypothetical protein
VTLAPLPPTAFAVSCFVAPTATDADVGVTVTEVTDGPAGSPHPATARTSRAFVMWRFMWNLDLW